MLLHGTDDILNRLQLPRFDAGSYVVHHHHLLANHCAETALADEIVRLCIRGHGIRVDLPSRTDPAEGDRLVTIEKYVVGVAVTLGPADTQHRRVAGDRDLRIGQTRQGPLDGVISTVLPDEFTSVLSELGHGRVETMGRDPHPGEYVQDPGRVIARHPPTLPRCSKVVLLDCVEISTPSNDRRGEIGNAPVLGRRGRPRARLPFGRLTCAGLRCRH